MDCPKKPQLKRADWVINRAVLQAAWLLIFSAKSTDKKSSHVSMGGQGCKQFQRVIDVL